MCTTCVWRNFFRLNSYFFVFDISHMLSEFSNCILRHVFNFKEIDKRKRTRSIVKRKGQRRSSSSYLAFSIRNPRFLFPFLFFFVASRLDFTFGQTFFLWHRRRNWFDNNQPPWRRGQNQDYHSLWPFGPSKSPFGTAWKFGALGDILEGWR